MGTQVAVAQIVVGAVIFLIVLIVVHLITARISDAILDSRVGMIDRVLGFIFGVLQGLHPDRHPLHVLRGLLPQHRAAFPWVRQAALPALHQGYRATRCATMLETHVPSSLTAPPGEQPQQEEQQGGP